MKRNTKALAMVLSAGTLFHSAGCLNLSGLAGGLLPLVSQAAYHAAFEYLLDSSTVWDLTTEGPAAAATP